MRWRRRSRFGTAPDGRLRFVLFRPSGSNFTIDAVVDDEGSGRLGERGSTVTLRLHRPASPEEDIDVERLLARWAAEDRLVDVTLAQDASVTALRADGSKMRLHVVA